MTDLPEIIRRLERLAPCHRNPDRYFEEKSELVAALRRLAAANDNRASVHGEQMGRIGFVKQ